MNDGIASLGLIGRVRATLAVFNDNAAAWLADASAAGVQRRDAVWALGSGVQYGIDYAVYFEYHDPRRSPFYGHVHAYAEEIGRLALYGELQEGHEWLVNNAVFWVGRLSEVVPWAV